MLIVNILNIYFFSFEKAICLKCNNVEVYYLLNFQYLLNFDISKTNYFLLT
jgi:hypothetical protein